MVWCFVVIRTGWGRRFIIVQPAILVGAFDLICLFLAVA